MDRGEYLADDDMIGIVKERLSRPDAANGYILDGFPRTIPQAQALDRMVQGEPLVIIDLTVPDSGAAAAHARASRVQQVRGDCRTGIRSRDVRALRRSDDDEGR